MPGSAITQAGNYALRIDTGFDIGSFKLNDPVKGILGGYTTNTTRTNLFPNPNMDATSISTNWQAVKFALTKSSDFAYNGSFSAKCVVNNGTSGQYFQTLQISAQLLDVVAGRTYTASAWVYTPATNTADTNFSVSLYFNNGVGYTGANTSTPVTVTRGTWTRISTTATVPAGYFKALPRFNSSTTLAVGQIVYFDACLLEESGTALPYFDGSFADPYTGYTLTAQQWNSTPDSSSSTTRWGLNSSYISSDYPLGPTTSYADITESTTRISIKRGRRDIGDQFSAGTMTFTINDVDGVFNPFDDNSPYYNTPEAEPGLAPLRAVELIRYDDNDNPEYLYRGKIVNYEYNFSLDNLDTVTVYCADNFYLLSQTFMDELNVAVETSGERIETVLDLPEVNYPTGTARNIDPGTVDLGHDSAFTVPAGTNVLAYLTQINQTAEFGRLFVSRAGVLTFTPRAGTTLSSSVANFHDDGTNIPYDGLGITFEADQVINRVLIENLDDAITTAEDLVSQATYFIQTNSITNSLLDNAELATAATYLLDPYPEARYNSVETVFGALTNAQRDTVAIIDINDTISIEKQFITGNTTMTLAQELSVEGVEHTITLDGHRVALFTSPTTVVYELLLDNAVYGTIDELNVLG